MSVYVCSLLGQTEGERVQEGGATPPLLFIRRPRISTAGDGVLL